MFRQRRRFNWNCRRRDSKARPYRRRSEPRTFSADRPLVIDDLGSGTLLDTAQFGLAPEPMVQSSVQAGADVITFSGDKLSGGSSGRTDCGQGGVYREGCARIPLARALRVDKMTLAALDATLRGLSTRAGPQKRSPCGA